MPPDSIQASFANLWLSAIEPESDVQITAAEGQAKAPTVRMTAYSGGSLVMDAWPFPVVVDLAGLKVVEPLTFLYNHDRERVVGQSDSVEVSARAVRVAGTITGENEWTAEVLSQAKNGFRWPLSIDARVQKMEFVDERTSVAVNGRSFKGPIYVARSCVLRGVSFVGIGADEKAQASIAAAAGGKENVMDFEKWLAAQGFDKATLSETQLTNLKALWQSQAAPAADPATKAAPAAVPPEGAAPTVPTKIAASAANADGGDAIVDYRNRMAAETERVAGIEAACAGRHMEIQARAIKENWTAERTKLEVEVVDLRAGRPKAPAIHVAGADAPPPGLVLEAAAATSLKLPTVEKQYPDQVLQAAHSAFRGRLGLQMLLLEAAWANGYTGRHFLQDPLGVQRAAFGEGRNIEAAFSSIDISGILSNVANKFLLDAYSAVEQVWRQICQVSPVRDFKTVTRYRLTAGLQYLQVGPGGEIKHGTLGEEKFTNKADTYGILLTLTRTDMINDDLGALAQTPGQIGRGGALKINDVFWTVFLNNADFFKDANKNVGTGAGSALGLGGLEAAELLFLNQTDPNGKPLGVQPAILLVPTAKSATARQLYVSQEIRDTTANVKAPVGNIFQGRYNPLTSAYMHNAKYTGASAAAWYLLARPSDVAVIEGVFLNGQESPIIETADAEFNVLGIQMRGYHDFGFALQDPRGGVRMAGS